MPRRRKNEDSTLARLLGKFGLTVDGKQGVGNIVKSSVQYGDNFESTADRLAKIRTDMEMAQQRAILEAESVIAYIDTRGKHFKDRDCKECGQKFAHTLTAVAFCSNVCRAKDLARRGIAWNIYGKTDVERWGGRIPKVLSPEGLKAALEAIEHLPDEEEEVTEEEPVEIMTGEEMEMEAFDIMLQETQAEILRDLGDD